jgi:hypothetical protein
VTRGCKTAIADQMLFIVAAMATEMQRDLIRERTLDGKLPIPARAGRRPRTTSPPRAGRHAKLVV